MDKHTNEKRIEKMKKAVEHLRAALNAEHEMNTAIHKYNSLYTQNTRLYRIDGILDQFRMIILDIKNETEDELLSLTHRETKRG